MPNTVHNRWLHPNTSYQLGRDRSEVERPNFIRVNEVYISKEHLLILVGQVTEMDNTNGRTPLKVIIQSKAMTRINGEKLRLSNGEEPYGIDLESNDEVVMQFREDKIRIKIHWMPLVLNFPQRVQIGGIIQANPVVEQLKKMADKGIDLRTTLDPEKATHYLAANDSPTYGLRISLLRGISIVNEKWIDFVLQNQDNYEAWFHIDTPDLLPASTKEQYYLYSNLKRGGLLHNGVVLVLEPPTAKLETIVSSIGGKVHYIDFSDLKSKDTSTIITRLQLQKDIWGQQTTYLLHPKAGGDVFTAISELVDSKAITLDDLFESVCSCSTLNLHQFEFRNLKRKADTQVSQSKRRRVKKVSKTEFFNFSPAPSQIEPSSTERTQASNLVENDEQTQAEKDLKPNAIELSQTIPPEDNTMMLSDSPNQEASEPAQPTDTPKTENPVGPTHSEYKKIGKFLPPVSFHEAVRRTKEKQTESIKKDLGLDSVEDEISLQLVDLAVVEYVPLIRPKVKGTKTPPADYSGRKNFKNFKKIALNVKVRLRVELVAATTITEKPQTGIDYNSIPEVANFAGEMPPVKGVEPRGILDQYYMEEDAPLFSFRNQEPESSTTLFVSEEDSQVAQATNTNFASTSKVEDDDDDDDDDDQPRFTFRRH